MEVNWKWTNRTLKDELPRSVGAQYTTGDQWRNNSRKNEEMEPKQKQALGVGDGQEDLVCYSPWDHKESDTTDWLKWTELMQYCSLQHQTLLPSPVTSTPACCFWLLVLLWLHPFILSGLISPLIPSVILGTYQPGEFIFQCSFCLFILFMGFSRQEYWSVLPFPSPVDHMLSECGSAGSPM